MSVVHSKKFFYVYCPDGVTSRYELLVFYDDDPFLPLTDFYHDCKRKISQSSALSYLQKSLFAWQQTSLHFSGLQQTLRLDQLRLML